MDPADMNAAPELLNQLANAAACLTTENVQGDEILHTKCLEMRAACQTLFVNLGVLLSIGDGDGPEELTDSDVDEVRNVTFTHLRNMHLFQTC